MNILKTFTHFLASVLSRVHLVRSKRGFVVHFKVTSHDTDVGISEKGSHAKEDQNE